MWKRILKNIIQYSMQLFMAGGWWQSCGKGSFLSSHLKHKVAGKLTKKSLPAHPKWTAIVSASMVKFNFYTAIDVQNKVGLHWFFHSCLQDHVSRATHEMANQVRFKVHKCSCTEEAPSNCLGYCKLWCILGFFEWKVTSYQGRNEN